MSPHHSDQMSQRSQVSRIAPWRCFLNVFAFVIVFVFVFVTVFLLVRSCLLITLITCLKGHKSLKVLCGSVFQKCLITGMDRRIPRAPSKQYSSAYSASASSSRWRPWGPTAVAANTWKRSSSFFRRRRMPTRTDCISKCNLMQKIVVILFTTEIK